MSKAFTREYDESSGVVELPDRFVSPHPNLVTPKGLTDIDEAIERLSREHAQALAAEDKEAIARTSRDLRYWTARRNNAQVVPAPADAAQARFGSTVTIVRDDGRREIWRIVGEDEADPAQGTLPYVAPVARALIGRSVGDVVRAGNSDAEIIDIV